MLFFYRQVLHFHYLAIVVTFVSKATSLKASGSVPLLPKFSETVPLHFVANDGDNAFCCLEVVGNPAPKIEWFKVYISENHLFYLN